MAVYDVYHEDEGILPRGFYHWSRFNWEPPEGDKRPQRIVQYREWCKKNCEDDVVFDYDYNAYFRNESDLVAFKLRWV